MRRGGPVGKITWVRKKAAKTASTIGGNTTIAIGQEQTSSRIDSLEPVDRRKPDDEEGDAAVSVSGSDEQGRRDRDSQEGQP